MNLGQMLFNGKCKVFAPFYYIPMEIGIKYFLQGNFSIKIINIHYCPVKAGKSVFEIVET